MFGDILNLFLVRSGLLNAIRCDKDGVDPLRSESILSFIHRWISSSYGDVRRRKSLYIDRFSARWIYDVFMSCKTAQDISLQDIAKSQIGVLETCDGHVRALFYYVKMMKTTRRSMVSIGLPLNSGSIMLATGGIMLYAYLLFAYQQRLETLTNIISNIHPIFWISNIQIIATAHVIIMTAYGIGILSRLGVILGSFVISEGTILVSTVVVIMELIVSFGCAIWLLEMDSVRNTPIISVVASIIQAYCVVVFLATARDIREKKILCHMQNIDNVVVVQAPAYVA